jgi:hypothetical protein
MTAFTRPKVTLAGLVSTIFAALVMSVWTALPVSLRFSFIDDSFVFADCELPSSLAELLVRP